MGTIKLDKNLYPLIHIHFHCPLCAEKVYTGDKRYKKERENYTISIYRASETSITLQCKKCKLKYMVTWRNFQKALKMYAMLRPGEKFDSGDNFYNFWSKALDYFVDTKYSTRKPPVKRIE